MRNRLEERDLADPLLIVMPMGISKRLRRRSQVDLGRVNQTVEIYRKSKPGFG
ncbi:hypothetical protein [Synechococcus sp. Cu2B8-bc1011]|uniref:hypothetical protein n=1 Tax=Synechococcus sp. Cu2B8-bc1011 TaxID=3093725 RepID=UPI0039B0A064